MCTHLIIKNFATNKSLRLIYNKANKLTEMNASMIHTDSQVLCCFNYSLVFVTELFTILHTVSCDDDDNKSCECDANDIVRS